MCYLNCFHGLEFYTGTIFDVNFRICFSCPYSYLFSFKPPMFEASLKPSHSQTMLGKRKNALGVNYPRIRGESKKIRPFYVKKKFLFRHLHGAKTHSPWVAVLLCNGDGGGRGRILPIHQHLGLLLNAALQFLGSDHLGKEVNWVSQEQHWQEIEQHNTSSWGRTQVSCAESHSLASVR